MILENLFNVFGLFLFLGCLSAKESPPQNFFPYLLEIKHSIEEDTNTEFHLSCSCFSGSWDKKIEKVKMHFHAYRRSTLEEARALQVTVMNKLVRAIDSHEQLQPYLKDRPFTHKNVEVEINFLGPEGSYADGSIVRICNHFVTDEESGKNRNKLSYYTANPFEYGISFFDESYEEAMDRHVHSNLKYPYEHKTTNLESAIDEVFDAFLEEIKQRHLYRNSIGGIFSNNIEEIDARLEVSHRAEVSEARELILFATNRLLALVNSSQKLKPYLLETSFPVQRLKMSIGFRNEISSPYFDGTLESVIIEEAKIIYRRELSLDEEGELKKEIVATESYQDALKAIEKAKKA